MMKRTKLIEIYELCEELADYHIQDEKVQVMLLNETDTEVEYMIILPEKDEALIVGAVINIETPGKLYGNWKKEFYLINHESYKEIDEVDNVLQTLKSIKDDNRNQR